MAPRTRELRHPDLIAAAVTARRNYLRLKQENVPGVSRSVISLLENVGQTKYQVRNLVALGIAFDWPEDWVDRVEAGESLTSYSSGVSRSDDETGVSPLDALRAEVDGLKQAVAELQATSQPALWWLAEVAERVGVARPAALRSVPGLPRLNNQGRPTRPA